MLGVYDWDGVNSIPPEMWMLPNWFPFHPGKMWCHARMVYLPMCYIYGQRWVYPGARLATGEDEDVPPVPGCGTAHDSVSRVGNVAILH